VTFAALPTAASRLACQVLASKPRRDLKVFEIELGAEIALRCASFWEISIKKSP
jgi:hypothetical protein